MYNKTYYLALLFLIYIFSTQFAHSQEWVWTEQLSGDEMSQPSGLLSDDLGNIYYSLQLQGTIILSNDEIISKGARDVLLVKMDKSGKVMWYHQFGGEGDEVANSLAFDMHGNIIVSGSFSETASFVNTSVTSVGSEDVFMAKYDQEGNELWVKNVGQGLGKNRPRSLCVDENNHIYITGFYTAQISFDNYTLEWGEGQENFFAKFDNNGNTILAKRLESFINSRLVDAVAYNNQVIVSGKYYNTITVNDTVHKSMGVSDIVVMSLDETGEIIWSRTMGTIGDDFAYGLSLDNDGNIYLTGRVSGDLNVDGTIYKGAGNNDILFSKLDILGNEIWTKVIGSDGVDYGRDIQIYNNVLAICGMYSGQLAWGEDTLISNEGGIDAFIGFCDVDGDLLYALDANGDGWDQVFNTCFTKNGLYANSFSTSGSLKIGNDIFINDDFSKEVFVSKVSLKMNLASAIITQTCGGSCNGRVVLSVNGGVEPFSYELSNGDIGDGTELTGLCAGDYSIKIVDSKGFVLETDFEITEDTSIITNEPDNYIVEGDQHWHGSYTLTQDLIVKKNAKLTLHKCNMQFAENTGIIVEKKGKLKVKHSTLQGFVDCGNEWNGITSESKRGIKVKHSKIYDVVNTNTCPKKHHGKKHHRSGVSREFEEYVDEDASLISENELLDEPYIFPNPAADEMNIFVTDLDQIDDARLIITDINGTVHHTRYIDSHGSYYNLNISYLKSGMYFIHINTTLEKKTLRFIKL